MTGKENASLRSLPYGAEIILASHNQGKVKEFSILLAEAGLKVHSAAMFNLPEPEETETSFEGNARLKALAAARASGLPALADDSGFCVSALDGAPGIYSARWAGSERDMGRAMARVHEEMAGTGSADKTACFKVVLCLAWPDGVCRFVTGLCEGEVVWPPRGLQGHGYDPIFVPQGENRTFAEMGEREKNLFSHRAMAVDVLLKSCIA